MINPKTGRRRIFVLDTDGHNLPYLEGLEEMLFTLQRWEGEQPGPDQDPMDLPAPVASGRALAAMKRVRAALMATQGELAVAARQIGSLWARTVDRSWGLEPGSRLELVPLRLVDVDQDDVQTLIDLHAVLSDRNIDRDIQDAAEKAAGWTTPAGARSDRTAADLYRDAAQLVALLSMEWDGAARALADVLATRPPADDLELTASQAAAYRKIAAAIVRAAGGDALDVFVAGAFE